MNFARALLLCLLCVLAPAAWALVEVPPLTGRVVDAAGLLTLTEASALDRKLAAFETQKSSQIAVLTVPSVAPEDLAQFGIRVAEAWKIGRKKVDDGVLLIVARDDRAVRIEVGYGLEGAIPDAAAKRVIAEIIVPRFRDDDYAGGIDAGVDALIGLAEGEALPASGQGELDGDNFALIALGGMVFGWLLSLAMSRSAAGGIAAATSALLVGLVFGFSLIVLFIALFVFAGVAGGRSRGGFNGGGWSSGSGGGWSGGGGRFGGGGASGRW